MVCALLAVPARAADLPEVLTALGREAAGQEKTNNCQYRETTTVDELNKEGQVIGSEVRVFDVRVKGMEILQRKTVSVKASGAPLADLLQQPRDTKGRKQSRSPFHPESQKDYRFRLEEGPGEGELSLEVQPLRPSMSRPEGTMVLDAQTLKAKSFAFRPSRVPPLLKTFSSRYEYDDTACGRMPVSIENEGQGVDIFVETKFRTHSVMDRHLRDGAKRPNA